MIISLRTTGDEKGGASPLQVIQNPLNLIDEIDGFKKVLDLIFIGAGFSPIMDNSLMKSATEIIATQELTNEALRLLKPLRIDQFTRIFSKVVIIGINAGKLNFDWDGMGEPPFVLSFPPEENMNKEEEIQISLNLINNNLSDHVTEIAKMNSISKEEAEIRLQEILANNKKVFEATSYQQETLGDGKPNNGNPNNDSGKDNKPKKVNSA